LPSGVIHTHEKQQERGRGISGQKTLRTTTSSDFMRLSSIGTSYGHVGFIIYLDQTIYLFLPGPNRSSEKLFSRKINFLVHFHARLKMFLMIQRQYSAIVSLQLCNSELFNNTVTIV